MIPTWQQQRAEDHWRELARLASMHRLVPRRPRARLASTWAAVTDRVARRPQWRVRQVAVECCD